MKTNSIFSVDFSSQKYVLAEFYEQRLFLSASEMFWVRKGRIAENTEFVFAWCLTHATSKLQHPSWHVIWANIRVFLCICETELYFTPSTFLIFRT